MEYKISFSDKSYMFVDDSYVMHLYRKINGKPFKVSIKAYLKFWETFIRNFFFIDCPDSIHKVPLSFSVISSDERKNVPLNMRVKDSQDINVGDFVAGPNGPVIVSDLHTGEENLFEIKIGDNTYTVNEGHILHLVDKEDESNVLDIQVGVYIQMDDCFKSKWYMERIIDD